MPSLTVKAAAEMLKLPAFSQARILTDQKYPKSGAQAFRTPYYRTALLGIQSFFINSNSEDEIVIAQNKAAALSQKTRSENNLRVLNSFKKSSLHDRMLYYAKNSKIARSIGNVEFRLSPDFIFEENGKTLLLYLNCRSQPLDTEVARLTIEIAHWVVEISGIKIKIDQIEYFDLCNNTSYSFKKRRATTIKNLEENAKVIDAIWPTL